MLCTKLYFHFTFFLTYFRAIFIEKQLVGKMNILAFEKGIIINCSETEWSKIKPAIRKDLCVFCVTLPSGFPRCARHSGKMHASLVEPWRLWKLPGRRPCRKRAGRTLPPPRRWSVASDPPLFSPSGTSTVMTSNHDHPKTCQQPTTVHLENKRIHIPGFIFVQHLRGF